MSDGYIAKTDLFKEIIPEEDYEIPGRGMVRIRALTRPQIDRCGAEKKDAKGSDVEYRIAVFGFKEPEINADDAKAWAASSSAGEFQKVVKRISEISGMDFTEAEAKETETAIYDQFRE